MSINSKIKKDVETLLNTKITEIKSAYGGCIADSKIVSTQNGKKYFLKTLQNNEEVFEKEANGLKEIELSKAIATPKIIALNLQFLLLEYVIEGEKTIDFFYSFGKQFAQMHKYKSNYFGFYEDNFIGSSPQYNIAEGSEKENWAVFFFQKRLLPQLNMAKKNRLATQELSKGIGKLEGKIENILAKSQETPSLLHGDLWGGNYLCKQNKEAVLIDPAVYYGHREADLAMTRMFGGFSSEFYSAYQQTYPLEEGWEYRQNIYLLYHYLNHLNLFGNSYYSSCMKSMNCYL